MPDLDAEFLPAVRRVGWDDAATPAAKWLAARGLTARRRLVVGGVGVMHVSLYPAADLFEPADDGEKALVVASFDGLVEDVIADGDDAGVEPFDLVAWLPGAPECARRSKPPPLAG